MKIIETNDVFQFIRNFVLCSIVYTGFRFLSSQYISRVNISSSFQSVLHISLNLTESLTDRRLVGSAASQPVSVCKSFYLHYCTEEFKVNY